MYHHVNTAHPNTTNRPPAFPTDAQEAAPAAAVEEAALAAEPAAAKEAVEEEPLPDGWAQDVTDEGRVYYIDHVNKGTSCRELPTRSSPPQPPRRAQRALIPV